MDIVYVGITVAFFALTWGLMRMCENLGKQDGGERL